MGGPVDLSFRGFGGDGPPILLLHGLFGSSQNMAGVGRRLSLHWRCAALDLRNHGDSPHDPSMSLEDCVEDLERWCALHEPRPVTVVGHSMGGLAAMGFAIRHPERVTRLVVVDIAPRVYPVDHEDEFRALGTDISGCATRAELDALLAPILPEERVRSFILTNAVRGPVGFSWRLNVDALRSARIFSGFSTVTGRYEGDTLFVVGGRSDKVRPEDMPRMSMLFPGSRVVVIPDADHWVHATAREPFMEILEKFLSGRN